MQVARRKLLFSLLAPLILAAGCARTPMAVPEIVKPYRITIQQGNYVTREMVQQLKPGMTREQVRYILGTPLLTDIFHADRWDYVFYLDAPGGKREQRNFSVMFEEGKLTRVLGDMLPSEPVQAAPKPVAKPEPKPAAKPEPKAELKPEAPKPVAEAVKPAAAPEAKTEPAAEAKPEDKPARGFFGRMLEKIGF